MSVIRYTPPKSNLWGHLMGRQSPAAFRAGVASFLREAAASYDSTSCHVILQLSSGDTSEDGEFVSQLKAAGANRFFDYSSGSAGMEAKEFDFHLDWLVAHQDRIPGRESSACVHLRREYRIHAWRCNPRALRDDLGSMLVEGYGNLQYLATWFAFANLDDYRFVKGVAEQTLGLRMNDRNIRPRSALAG